MTNVTQFRDKHINSDIYIIGSGRQLAELTSYEKKFLESQITIALNTAFLGLKCKYWISAHIGMALIADALSGNELIKIFKKTTFWNININEFSKNFIEVPRIFFDGSLSRNDEVIKSQGNVFAATHLAYIMGAKRIIYVGIDHINLIHHYHLDKEVRNQLLQVIPKLILKYRRCRRAKKELENQKITLEKSIEVSKQSLFYNNPKEPRDLDYYKKAFCTWFDLLEGVEIITTIDYGVLSFTQAKYISIKNIYGKR